MVRWHHWLNGHEFEQGLGDCGGQRSLASSMGSQKVEDNLATEEQQFFFITLFTPLKKLLYTCRLIWSDIFILNLPPELQNRRSNHPSPQVPQSPVAPPLNQYPILEVTPWAFPILVNAKLVHLDIQIRDPIVILEASHKSLSHFFFHFIYWIPHPIFASVDFLRVSFSHVLAF